MTIEVLAGLRKLVAQASPKQCVPVSVLKTALGKNDRTRAAIISRADCPCKWCNECIETIMGLVD